MDDNHPITLKEACKIFFRDTLSVYSLRAEADRGRLVIFLIGKRYYTTPADIRAFIEFKRQESLKQRPRAIPDIDQQSYEQQAAGALRAELRRLMPRKYAKEDLQETIAALKDARQKE